MEAVAVLKFIEEYQCPGCVCESDTNCYKSESESLECTKHVAGTMAFPMIGSFFLGMPKGFNRLGSEEKLKINIFASFSDGWGIPSLMYLFGNILMDKETLWYED